MTRGNSPESTLTNLEADVVHEAGHTVERDGAARLLVDHPTLLTGGT